MILGAGLLWFGWFGFNGGSALAANNIAVSAVVATNLAAAAAAVSWMIMDWVIKGKPSAIGIAVVQYAVWQLLQPLQATLISQQQ